MTTYQPGFSHYLLPASSLFAMLAISGGIYGLVSPSAWFSKTFGRPAPTRPTNLSQAAASFAAARNVTAGITLLGLIALGDRKAVAVFFMAGSITAFADGLICFKFGGKAAIGHAIMGLLVGTLGVSIWYA